MFFRFLLIFFNFILLFFQLFFDILVEVWTIGWKRVLNFQRAKPPRLGEDKNGGVILHNVCKKTVHSRDEVRIRGGQRGVCLPTELAPGVKVNTVRHSVRHRFWTGSSRELWPAPPAPPTWTRSPRGRTRYLPSKSNRPLCKVSERFVVFFTSQVFDLFFFLCILSDCENVCLLIFSGRTGKENFSPR